MSIFESLLNTFETGSGFWNPIVWLVVIIIGNPEYSKEKMHIKGSNLY